MTWSAFFDLVALALVFWMGAAVVAGVLADKYGQREKESSPKG